jgi:hypothetical protein
MYVFGCEDNYYRGSRYCSGHNFKLHTVWNGVAYCVIIQPGTLNLLSSASGT